MQPLKAEGKYSKYIDPPNGLLYRGFKMELNSVKKMFNLDTDKLSSGEVIVLENFTINPKTGTKVMSWSTDKDVAEDFLEHINGTVVVFLQTTANNNNFYLNPTNINKDFNMPRDYKFEKEVISFGPVKVEKAVLTYHPILSDFLEKNLLQHRPIIQKIANEIISFINVLVKRFIPTTDNIEAGLENLEDFMSTAKFVNIITDILNKNGHVDKYLNKIFVKRLENKIITNIVTLSLKNSINLSSYMSFVEKLLYGSYYSMFDRQKEKRIEKIKNLINYGL